MSTLADFFLQNTATISFHVSHAECYNSSDYGQSYGGTHSHTVSNLPCMDWSDSNTSFTAAQYPELVGANNTCRNPGQWAKAPWCFNQHGLVEPCLVQSCSTHGESRYLSCIAYNIIQYLRPFKDALFMLAFYSL